MNHIEYQKMADFERDYWWHRGKKFLLKTLIENVFESAQNLDTLEIGCGTGEITSFLKNYGKITGVDISKDAVDFCTKRNLENIYLHDVNQMDTAPYKDRFDLVLALDVLEHIQEDLETIKRARYMLKPDGYFLVNVPAHKFLWSQHDEALHHKRRYTRYEITKKLEKAGFVIEKSTYFVTTVFPAIVLFRLWSNFFGKTEEPKTSYIPLPKQLNDFATKILEFEAKFVRNFKFPIGTTIVIVAKK